MVIILIIMVFSKLFPIIPCILSNDFCKIWNDFLFGISCSIFCGLIASCIMYYYTDLKPSIDFANNVKPILKQKLTIIHDTYDYVFQQFGGMGDFEKFNDNDLVNIMKRKNLADKLDGVDLLYKDILERTFMEVRQLTTEILSYHKCLDNQQIKKLENIVNMTYRGHITANKCNADSEAMYNSVIKGSFLINWLQLFETENFMNDTFIPSYRMILELEKSFN